MSKPESQPVTKAASGKNAEIHKNHRTRMRERLDADGLHTFHDHEALEMLLYYVYPQGDVNPVAHRLMNKFGCFHRVLEATPDQLIAVEGIGESAARLLHLVFQFCQRYHQDCAAYRAKGIPLKSTKQLAYYLASHSFPDGFVIYQTKITPLGSAKFIGGTTDVGGVPKPAEDEDTHNKKTLARLYEQLREFVRIRNPFKMYLKEPGPSAADNGQIVLNKGFKSKKEGYADL
jgi:hypothetical protein